MNARAESPLRVAVVGAGHLGAIHARVYRQLEGVELVGVVDANEERARKIAERHGVKAFARASDLPADLHAASVATPSTTHAEIATPFLRRGVAVLVEKPIAVASADARAMVEAARASGAVLSVGHSERFNPGVRAIREMGIRPRFVEGHRLAAFSFRSQDVGVVLDLMIHDLDLLLHLVDPKIVSVDAVGGAVLTDREDVVSARIRFSNGCVANLTASRVSLNPMRRLRFFSPDSYVAVDLGKRYALAVKKGPRWDAERGRLAELDAAAIADPKAFVFGGLLEVREEQLSSDDEPLRLEIEAFLRAVRGEGENPCSGEEGARALEAAERILREMDRHAWSA